jgi:hypothetical protein
MLERKEWFPLQIAQVPKSLNPFTCALAPPFIGRWRDFYIPKTPSSSENIPSVNTYKNVFFTQYIYKSATSSHSKPGLFGTTTLTLLIHWFVNVFPRDSRFESSANSRIGLASPPVRACPRARLPNWVLSRFPNRRSSEFGAIASSRFWASACSWPHRFTSQDSRTSHFREFEAFIGSRLPKIVSFLPLKNMSQELC